MPEKEISFFAALVQQFGIVNVAFSFVLVTFALSIPTLLTWIKESGKRKKERDLIVTLNDLSAEIRILARGYSDSISLGMAENILENVLKNHSWHLFDFIRDIIEKNDIKNERKSIEKRVTMQIGIVFTEIDNSLMKFKFKTKSLNEFIDRCEWEQQIFQVVIKTIYDSTLTAQKRIANSRAYINNEFGNINYMALQNLNKY